MTLTGPARPGGMEPVGRPLRPICMRRFLMLAVGVSALLAGCATGGQVTTGTSQLPTPPAGFGPACGHPGTLVTLLAVPVVVKRDVCDITGVNLRYGLAEVTVPASGRAERQVETFAPTTAPLHILVVVDPTTGDVTVTG